VPVELVFGSEIKKAIRSIFGIGIKKQKYLVVRMDYLEWKESHSGATGDIVDMTGADAN